MSTPARGAHGALAHVSIHGDLGAKGWFRYRRRPGSAFAKHPAVQRNSVGSTW